MMAEATRTHDLFAALDASPKEDAASLQRRWRIRLAVMAYAYEIECDPIASDAEFDALAMKIDTSVSTGRPQMDEWFRDNFDPYTGQWIYAHPDLDGVKRIYRRVVSLAQEAA